MRKGDAYASLGAGLTKAANILGEGGAMQKYADRKAKKKLVKAGVKTAYNAGTSVARAWLGGMSPRKK